MAISLASITQSIMPIVDKLANYLTPIAVKIGISARLLFLILLIVILVIIIVAVVKHRKSRESKSNYGTGQTSDAGQTKEQALRAFVQKALGAGVNARRLYNELLVNGWPEELVRKVLYEQVPPQQAQLPDAHQGGQQPQA